MFSGKELVLAGARKQAATCTACPRGDEKLRDVYGNGGASAKVMFIGGVPSHHEAIRGIAFDKDDGAVGELAHRMAAAMGLSEEDSYWTHIVKCRVERKNQSPTIHECGKCVHKFLRHQISIVQPRGIVSFDVRATDELQHCSPNSHGASAVCNARGNYVRVMPWLGKRIPWTETHHPDLLLREPKLKAEAWADLQMLMAVLGLQAGEPLVREPTEMEMYMDESVLPRFRNLEL